MGLFPIRFKQLANIGLVVLLDLAHEWGHQRQTNARVDSALDLLVELEGLEFHNDFGYRSFQV